MQHLAIRGFPLSLSFSESFLSWRNSRVFSLCTQRTKWMFHIRGVLINLLNILIKSIEFLTEINKEKLEILKTISKILFTKFFLFFIVWGFNFISNFQEIYSFIIFWVENTKEFFFNFSNIKKKFNFSQLKKEKLEILKNISKILLLKFFFF